MTMRTRLLLTGVGIAIPLAVAWFLIVGSMRLVAKEDELRLSVAADLANGLQDRCEANPPATGRPGRGGFQPPQRGGPQGRDGGRGGPPQRGGPPPAGEGARGGPPRGGEAPRREPGPGANRPGGAGGAYQYYAYDAAGRPSAADAPELPAVRDGAASTKYWAGAGFGVALVVPLGGEGPCAYLLARIPPRPAELRDQLQALLLVVVSVLGAAWFAAGPVIGRLRRLGEAVRLSAASQYETPVATGGGDEVASLAKAFNEAGQQVRSHLVDLQAREQTLREFVANTTHDVAIPLTVLQGHLAALDAELAAPEHREHVRAAVQEAHYMGSLLRNLGAATTLDGAAVDVALSSVDLSALVERVVARHRPIARASGVELNAAVPDPPLVFPSDPTLLDQALSNLVDNAVRYNHAGGHVAVLLDHADGGFVLSVTDDGPGVSDEELAQLTRRWFRGSEARTRRPDGKGLGLAIVSESVGRLGLALEFSRPVGGGLRADISSRQGGSFAVS
jgi:two-component system, OmpR family, sensor histidine kinase BaeS